MKCRIFFSVLGSILVRHTHGIEQLAKMLINLQLLFIITVNFAALDSLFLLLLIKKTKKEEERKDTIL